MLKSNVITSFPDKKNFSESYFESDDLKRLTVRSDLLRMTVYNTSAF